MCVNVVSLAPVLPDGRTREFIGAASGVSRRLIGA
jgi:hypothetical protein